MISVEDTGCGKQLGPDVLSDLPLVSVIVLNYNYGMFVCEALQSVKDQTYPNIEIIIVDDNSTDDSWAVIGKLTCQGGQFEEAEATQTPENLGLTGATAFGFHRSTGSYVIFLDADDVLYPRCIETHIYVHLSSRVLVGFTSVDHLTVSDGRVVTTTTPNFARYVASKKGQCAENFRPIDVAAPFLWFEGKSPPVGWDSVHLAEAPYCDPWIWSSSSGICYRRRALNIMLDGKVPLSMRTQTDAYLIRPISAISGSIIIDRPLMGYRVHGKNLFARTEPLARLRTFDTNELEDMEVRLRNSITKLFEDVKIVASLIEDPYGFIEAVNSIASSWPGVRSEVPGSTFLYECILKHERNLRAAFPRDFVDDWICGERAKSATPLAPSQGMLARLRACLSF